MSNPVRFTGLALLFVLGGCSTVGSEWAPFPQNNELTSFADRWAGAPKSGAGTEVATMQRELVKYRDEIFSRALDRHRLEWESSGLTTYGGLAAVAGALADRTGLLNTGAGLAAIGLANSTRFRFQDQKQIYVTALKRVACITGKVNAVNDLTVSLAKGASDQTAAAAARNFIDTVIAAVDYVRGEYTNGLLGLTPTVPSREELLALLNTYRVQGPLAVAGGQDPAQVARDQAGETMKGIATELQSCSKL
jgi:hypothetical protein